MTRVPVYVTRIDVASSTITYIGKAIAGSLTSEAVWQIKRLESNPEGDIIIIFTGGIGSFNYVWDDHASLSYP